MFLDNTYLDLIGAVLSLITTYLFIKINSNAWKVGILATTINTILYVSQGIYGQAILESLYFAGMWYGLWQWQKNYDNNQSKITSLSGHHSLVLIFIIIMGIPLFTYILSQSTNSNIAIWDASTCILSLMAQWLLCRKIIQTWILWFIVDTLIIALHLHKAIPFHAILHAVYLIMAIVGYFSWKTQKSYYQAD